MSEVPLYPLRKGWGAGTASSFQCLPAHLHWEFGFRMTLVLWVPGLGLQVQYLGVKCGV